MMSPELQAKIALWQQKALAGTLTLEEQREAIRLMRADRITASVTTKTSRSKAPARSADDLLGDLVGM